jgi:hypothetical protein
MKLGAIALIAAGAVVGFVLGGLAPRRELRALQADRDALQAQLDAVDRPNLLETFLPALGERREQADAPRPPAAEAAASPGAPPSAQPVPGAPPPPQGDVAVIGATERAQGAAPARPAPTAPAAAAETTRAAAPGASPDGDEQSRDDARGEGRRGERWLERYDQLVTAQRARTAAARVALIEQAELDEAEVAQVDATITRMNSKLSGYGEEVIAQAASEKRPSPAQALGLGHDVSGILYEGQKALDAVVGDAAPAVDSSALQIWNYVDLEQWRPFVEKQLAARREGGAAAAAAAGSGPE